MARAAWSVMKFSSYYNFIFMLILIFTAHACAARHAVIMIIMYDLFCWFLVNCGKHCVVHMSSIIIRHDIVIHAYLNKYACSPEWVSNNHDCTTLYD